MSTKLATFMNSNPARRWCAGLEPYFERLAEPPAVAVEGKLSRMVGLTLEAVGLADRMQHYPNELSGGQQQRVAIARAIVSDPRLIVADEPTGDLDRVSASDILAMMQRLNSELGKTIIMVTHDANAAHAAKKLIHLDKGEINDG